MFLANLYYALGPNCNHDYGENSLNSLQSLWWGTRVVI